MYNFDKWNKNWKNWVDFSIQLSYSTQYFKCALTNKILPIQKKECSDLVHMQTNNGVMHNGWICKTLGHMKCVSGA